MKRGIVLQVRESENKKNGNEKTIWIVIGLLPSKMKNGGLYYPKTTDVCVSTCAGMLTKPDKYSYFKSLTTGSIVKLEYGVNDYANKVFVENIETLCESPFDDNDLFG